MKNIYMPVTKKQFKSILKNAPDDKERKRILFDSLAVNAAMMANERTLEENLSAATSEHEVTAERLSESLGDETLTNKKFEKAVIGILFAES